MAYPLRIRGPLFMAMLAGVVTGCSVDTPSQPPAASEPQPASAFSRLSRAEQVELLERDLRRHFGPDVRVGQIRRIATATKGVLIVDLDTAGLREEQSVLFVDQGGKAIAAGDLLVVRPGELIARFDESLVDGGREVELDDFAVVNLGR